MNIPKPIYITDFPLPPSSNHMYKTVMFGRTPRRVPGKEYKLHLRDADIWAKKKGKDLIQFWGSHIKDRIHQGFIVSVDTYFIFPRSKIWTLPTYKKNPNAAKKIDASNRIKIAHDSIAEILGVDDSYFFCGWYEKIESSDERERTVMVFNFRKPRRSDELVFPSEE